VCVSVDIVMHVMCNDANINLSFMMSSSPVCMFALLAEYP